MSRTTLGLSTLARIANRRRPGTTSRKSSIRLPARSADLVRQAGHVAARPRQACDEAVSNRIARYREDDRNDRRRSLCRDDGRSPLGYATSTLSRTNSVHDLGEALVAALRPAILDRDITPFGPAAFA